MTLALDPPPSAPRIEDLGTADVARRLRAEGLPLQVGPVRVRLRSGIRDLADHLALHYGRAPVLERSVVDFDLRLVAAPLSFRPFEMRARIMVDGEALSDGFARRLACPAFEWGFNWAVATRIHRWTTVHAAVLERDGSALAMPGYPGSGKSTLSAALAFRGWRLFSDEFLLIDSTKGAALALPRPVSLKGGSVAALRRFAPEARLGAPHPGTRKGDLAHMAVPRQAMPEPGAAARPALIVFPRFAPGAAADLRPVPRGRAFMRIAENGFNYLLRGEAGFRDVRRLVKRSACWELDFENLPAAVDAIEDAFAAAARVREGA